MSWPRVDAECVEDIMTAYRVAGGDQAICCASIYMLAGQGVPAAMALLRLVLEHGVAPAACEPLLGVLVGRAGHLVGPVWLEVMLDPDQFPAEAWALPPDAPPARLQALEVMELAARAGVGPGLRAAQDDDGAETAMLWVQRHLPLSPLARQIVRAVFMLDSHPC